MLHLLWLKHYTHDYDGIIYLSLSVTVTVTVQLRSFRSHYFYCLSQTVLDLEDSLDLKTEILLNYQYYILLNYQYYILLNYQYYNFRPKRNTLKMFNARHFPISQWHWRWLGNTLFFRYLKCFLRLTYERIACSECISSPQSHGVAVVLERAEIWLWCVFFLWGGA